CGPFSLRLSTRTASSLPLYNRLIIFCYHLYTVDINDIVVIANHFFIIKSSYTSSVSGRVVALVRRAAGNVWHFAASRQQSERNVY
ncbi:MAG UNVERIFIED_CONTAM: hypothetical protein MIL04_24845, partial [Klebsiella aerogenes]